MQRQKMSLNKRAKIFLPFDALEGFREELIKKKKKLKEEDRIILSEDEINNINDALNSLVSGMLIDVRYYSFADKRYIDTKGIYIKMDLYSRYILVVKTKINIDDIVKITIISNELDI